MAETVVVTLKTTVYLRETSHSNKSNRTDSRRCELDDVKLFNKNFFNLQQQQSKIKNHVSALILEFCC